MAKHDFYMKIQRKNFDHHPARTLNHENVTYWPCERIFYNENPGLYCSRKLHHKIHRKQDQFYQSGEWQYAQSIFRKVNYKKDKVFFYTAFLGDGLYHC